MNKSIQLTLEKLRGFPSMINHWANVLIVAEEDINTETYKATGINLNEKWGIKQ